MIVLGIDPGSVICGYGVVEANCSNFKIIEYGVINAKKINSEFNVRLGEIYTRMLKVIERTRPDYAAFETIFYSKNVQSLVKLSHARSAAIIAAAVKEISITEFSPREVKKSVTGRGSASKEQVQFMVKKMLNIKETPEFFDSTDALAVALCHCMKSGSPAKSSKSWAAFVKDNPDRIVKL